MTLSNPQTGIPKFAVDMLNPQRHLDSRLTFSRAGNATMFDATGKLVWAPANMTRPSSHTTAYPWNSTNANRSQTDIYSSEDNARYGLLTETLTSGTHYSAPTTYTSLVIGQKYTLSVYLKKGTADYIQFLGHTTGFSANAFVNFSFLTGAIVKSGSAVVGTPIVRVLSGGDYRISFECLAVSSGAQANGNVCFINNDPNADIVPSYLGTGMTVYAGGVQVEPTSYNSPLPLNVTTSDLYFAPRFDYDPSTLALRGLLMEESRTNYCYPSIPDSGTKWILSETSFVSSVASPSGFTDASIIKDTTTSSAHSIRCSETTSGYSYTSGSTYTFSVYAKAGTATSFQITGQGAIFGTSQYANFNLTDGTLGTYAGNTTGILPKIQNIGGGWYRCSFTITATSTASASPFLAYLTNSNTSATRGPSYIGTEQTLYLYGAQLEPFTFATSYIPTYGATATRAADSLYTTNIPWFNATQGAFVVETEPIGITSTTTHRSASFSDGTTNNVIEIFSDSGSTRAQIVVSGSSGQTSSPAPTLGISINKLGVSYKNVNNIAYLNSVKLGDGTFASSSVPTGINKLNIMNRADNLRPLNGYVRSFRYWNYALSSAQLQSVTKV